MFKYLKKQDLEIFSLKGKELYNAVLLSSKCLVLIDFFFVLLATTSRFEATLELSTKLAWTAFFK